MDFDSNEEPPFVCEPAVAVCSPTDPLERIVWWDEKLDATASSLKGVRVRQLGNGECQFIALATGAGKMNSSELRNEVVQHLRGNQELREGYAPEPLTEDPTTYDEYCTKMLCRTTSGDERTLIAACTILGIGVWVFNVETDSFTCCTPTSVLAPSKFLYLTYRPHHYDIFSLPDDVQTNLKDKATQNIYSVGLSDLLATTIQPQPTPTPTPSRKRKRSEGSDREPSVPDR